MLKSMQRMMVRCLPGDQVDFIFEKDGQPFSSALIISTRRDKTVQGSAVLGTTAESDYGATVG